TIGRNLRKFTELDKDAVSVGSYDSTPRQIPGIDASVDRKKSFRDARVPFTEEQVRKETARCLSCGASVVDPNKCIGCGVCTTKCGFDAIHLERVHPEASRMIKSEDKMKAILPYMVKRAVKIRFSGNRKK
ncbi:MAG TPA: pyridine nucleotide-disulfide oxidoreductase, partial [Treponema sp.]|nr:pyridine nucleotide-disulfide oxidoreductase [Treponema sp.]